jgi:hypothetical protein
MIRRISIHGPSSLRVVSQVRKHIPYPPTWPVLILAGMVSQFAVYPVDTLKL